MTVYLIEYEDSDGNHFAGEVFSTKDNARKSMRFFKYGYCQDVIAVEVDRFSVPDYPEGHMVFSVQVDERGVAFDPIDRCELEHYRAASDNAWALALFGHRRSTIFYVYATGIEHAILVAKEKWNEIKASGKLAAEWECPGRTVPDSDNTYPVPKSYFENLKLSS